MIHHRSAVLIKIGAMAKHVEFGLLVAHTDGKVINRKNKLLSPIARTEIKQVVVYLKAVAG